MCLFLLLKHSIQIALFGSGRVSQWQLVVPSRWEVQWLTLSKQSNCSVQILEIFHYIALVRIPITVQTCKTAQQAACTANEQSTPSSSLASSHSASSYSGSSSPSVSSSPCTSSTSSASYLLSTSSTSAASSSPSASSTSSASSSPSAMSTSSASSSLWRLSDWHVL